MNTKLFRTAWLKSQIESGANARLSGAAGEILLGDGLPCDVLQPGMYWRSGKIRLKIEFVPDEVQQEQTD